MKLLLLAVFLAAATASPIPDDGGPVEVIVHGVPEGVPLELGEIVDITVKKKVDGEVVSASNALHPFTAVGIAEAEAALQPEIPEYVINPEPIELPGPIGPVVIPEPIELPEPVLPIVMPEPVELPSPVLPVVIPEPVELPSPALPEVIPEPIELPGPALPVVIPEVVELPGPPAPVIVEDPVESIPEPAPQAPNGEIFNDGVVSVTVNKEPGILTTLQSWFNMALNYISNGVTTSQQIV